MAKSIFEPGDTVADIEILAVVWRAKRSSYARYLVRYTCEHEDIISGSALVRRRHRKDKGFDSSQCQKCIRIESNRGRAHPFKRPDPPTKKQWEWSFNLMNEALSK